MGYHKRYEDSYLDEEEEEFSGDDMTDGEKLALLIQRPNRTLKDEALVQKLTERLFNGAKLPAPVGELAVQGIQAAADAYVSVNAYEKAAALWFRLSEIASAMGNGALYYRAMDEMGNLGGVEE